MLPGSSQQNGNPVSSQMQNPGIPCTEPTTTMDPEIVKMRRHMQEKIWEYLMHQRQQSHEGANRKLMDIVKRLEDGLFRIAKSKEEYLNLETLERRLHMLIKNFPNQNQQLANANSSVGTLSGTQKME